MRRRFFVLYSEIKALFSNVSWQEKIEGYECDILIKDKNIGIEIDGVHWHKRRPEVDKIKQKLFEARGILLFRLREEGLPLLSERDTSFKWSDNAYPIVCRLLKQILKFAQLDERDRLGIEDYFHGKNLLNETLYRKIVAQLPAPPVEISLAVKNPKVAKEWAYDLNTPLLPEHFRTGSCKNVWWRCAQGHVWKTSINNRVNQNTGCPACPRTRSAKVTGEWNFAAIHPDLVKEWHFGKNGDLHPKEIRPKSNKKLWWICNKGHEWQASPSSRSDGTGCPFCYGRFPSKTNNLAVLYPEILAEWDEELNKGHEPTDFTPHVSKKVWWKCPKDPNHSYQSTIYNRTKRRSGCPHCARNNSRRYSIEYFQEFAAKRGGKCLSTEYLSCRNNIRMICKDGHEWSTRADNILYEQKWCPVCKKNSTVIAQPSGKLWTQNLRSGR